MHLAEAVKNSKMTETQLTSVITIQLNLILNLETYSFVQLSRNFDLVGQRYAPNRAAYEIWKQSF